MNSFLKEIAEIDNSSLVDRVEAQLVKFLKDKKLKVGDSIPKELELAESLGVSRTVVREAMLRLRLMGLIQSKKKKGAVITSPDLFSLLQKGMHPHIMSDESLRDIFELRLMLEVGMADSLVQNVTKEDIEELKSIVQDELENSARTLFDIDYEVKFHGKLYEISGNETLHKFQHMLLPVFGYVHNSKVLDEYEANPQFVTHKGLVQILERGDADYFRAGMRQHLDSHFQRLFRHKKK